jgi:hypothetical protein
MTEQILLRTPSGVWKSKSGQYDLIDSLICSYDKLGQIFPKKFHVPSKIKITANFVGKS